MLEIGNGICQKKKKKNTENNPNKIYLKKTNN